MDVLRPCSRRSGRPEPTHRWPLKPYLQLVRLPNVFTAAADSLAGWLLVGGGLAEPGRWLPLSAASMAIYAAGIALNDVFDYEIDLDERPGRPLPSGRVSRRFAAWLGGILLALGPLPGRAERLVVEPGGGPGAGGVRAGIQRRPEADRRSAPR